MPRNANSWKILTLLLFSSSMVLAEKTISIRSTIHAKATPTEAFDLLKSLKRYPEWSPFLVTDPNQKSHVTGVDGELGSAFHWEGVHEKSAGIQTLAQAEEDSYIKFACTMKKPFAGKPVFEYRLKKSDGGVEIQQDFNLRLSTFNYLMTKIFRVRGKMTATNQLGMERLKAVLEKESRSNPDNNAI